jgi:hypothetical protein
MTELNGAMSQFYDKGGFNKMRLAKWLKNMEGKICNGVRIVKKIDSHSKVTSWAIQKI